LILLAHGIEVWNDLPNYKRKMLRNCDLIISVSHFTADSILEKYNFPKQKLVVLNNCLDPFLPLGKEYRNNDLLREALGYSRKEKIFFTLARISSKERYKGYDKVMEALSELIKTYPDVRYIIAGNYDTEEKDNILEYARQLGVQDIINLVGFVSDADLVAYFSMVDYYIMPSMKEGFGIVFIEAMYYGLPVVAGNRDGSVDALRQGDLGILVDPTVIESVRTAMNKLLENKNRFIPNRDILLKEFSYDSYKYKLQQILSN
jgi:glycosyltransferase involved in cell wall biosynthesis